MSTSRSIRDSARRCTGRALLCVCGAGFLVAGMVLGLGACDRSADEDAVPVRVASRPTNATTPFTQPERPAASEPTSGPLALPQVPMDKVDAPEHDLGEGLKYQIIKEGNGPVAKVGSRVKVDYMGWLSTGQMFDTSRSVGMRIGSPYGVTLGEKNVIAGWEMGIPGMKVGEKRRLIIPPELGYGSRGHPPKIPAGATLVFDIELVKVE